jgi:hypothetical protein
MARRVSFFCESFSKHPSKSAADSSRSSRVLLSQINTSSLKVTSPISQQTLKLGYNEIANSGESFSNLHLKQFPDVSRYHARSLYSSNFNSLRFWMTCSNPSEDTVDNLIMSTVRKDVKLIFVRKDVKLRRQYPARGGGVFTLTNLEMLEEYQRRWRLYVDWPRRTAFNIFLEAFAIAIASVILRRRITTDSHYGNYPTSRIHLESA